jgi:fructose-1,6-bisphosphatase/inositol monophosphatase family enzyme
VAARRADGLVLLPAEPWDVAAGLVLLGEAGLAVGDLAGGPAARGAGGILATSHALFEPAARMLDASPLAG